MSAYWQHDFGHYDAPHCGGVQTKSGKGAGPRATGMRHQAVLAFPAWGGKKGTDVYFSSRWDNSWQIYDHFHTPKSVDEWWTTAPWQYVFIQEVPYDLRRQEFVWDGAKNLPPSKKLAKKRRQQWKRFSQEF